VGSVSIPADTVGRDVLTKSTKILRQKPDSDSRLVPHKCELEPSS
jgi:hypothetical protein